MRFSVFTHVIHQEQNGRLYAYSPYLREMNLWFKSVEEVEIIAPLYPKEEELIFETPYEHNNIIFTSVPAFNLLSISAILKSVVRIPFSFFRILGAMKRADHLHLRCPGNIGLLAVVAQIFFPRKPKTVKYAGNWEPRANQPWAYRLQKWILRNTFLSRNIEVLVYGDWQGKSKNIVSFFTASFSQKEKEIIEKDFIQPYKFIYTGNLVEGKGIFEAIELIEAINKKGVNSTLEIYGDGILKRALNNYIQKKDLQKLVTLKGRKSLEELKEAYKKAHFLILLSKSEGWPKTIAEGMWYGCIPIATSISCVPWMLGKGSQGILLGSGFNVQGSLIRAQGSKFKVQGSIKSAKDESLESTVREVEALIENSGEMKRMSRAAQEWSQQYTLEKFEKSIQEILGKQRPNSNPQTMNYTPTTNNSEFTTDNNKQGIANTKPLRVLQVTDTLNLGGAERMAVNLANALVDEVEASYLCCTRQEGMLKEELDEKVGDVFLNKNHSLDLKSFWKLREFIKKEQIDLVHAHGTSWFWGVLLKVSGLKIKLVWHDHYGNRLKNKSRNLLLINSSKYFDGVLVLSDEQESWARRKLKSQYITKIPNFIVYQNKVPLKDKRKHNENFLIVSVANLRKPKNHLNLLKAFKDFSKKKNNVFLQLIGKDYNDNYSAELKSFIKNNLLSERVEIISGTTMVMPYLNNADLAVLSSDWEALPLSVLEYGLSGLPVIATDVGECPQILKNKGIIVPPGKVAALEKAICEYYANPLKRKEDALALQLYIKNIYTRTAVLPKLIKFYFSVREEHGRK